MIIRVLPAKNIALEDYMNLLKAIVNKLEELWDVEAYFDAKSMGFVIRLHERE